MSVIKETEPKFELVRHSRYRISDIASLNLPEVSTDTIDLRGPGANEATRGGGSARKDSGENKEGLGAGGRKESGAGGRRESGTGGRRESGTGGRTSYDNHINSSNLTSSTMNNKRNSNSEAATEQLTRLFDDIKKCREGAVENERRESYIDSTGCREHSYLPDRRASNVGTQSRKASLADRRGSMGERFLVGEKRFILNGGVERRASNSVGRPDQRRQSSGSYFSDRNFTTGDDFSSGRRSSSITQLADLNKKRRSTVSPTPGTPFTASDRRSSLAATDQRRASLLSDGRFSLSPSPSRRNSNSSSGTTADRRGSGYYGSLDRRRSSNGTPVVGNGRLLGSPRASPRRDLLSPPKDSPSIERSAPDGSRSKFQRDSLDVDSLLSAHRLSLYDSSIQEEDELPPHTKDTSPSRDRWSPGRRESTDRRSSSPVRRLASRTTPPRGGAPSPRGPASRTPRGSNASFTPVKYNDQLTSSFLSPGRDKRTSPSREFSPAPRMSPPPRVSPPRTQAANSFIARRSSDSQVVPQPGPLDLLFLPPTTADQHRQFYAATQVCCCCCPLTRMSSFQSLHFRGKSIRAVWTTH